MCWADFFSPSIPPSIHPGRSEIETDQRVVCVPAGRGKLPVTDQHTAADAWGKPFLLTPGPPHFKSRAKLSAQPQIHQIWQSEDSSELLYLFFLSLSTTESRRNSCNKLTTLQFHQRRRGGGKSRHTFSLRCLARKRFYFTWSFSFHLHMVVIALNPFMMCLLWTWLGTFWFASLWSVCSWTKNTSTECFFSSLLFHSMHLTSRRAVKTLDCCNY